MTVILFVAAVTGCDVGAARNTLDVGVSEASFEEELNERLEGVATAHPRLFFTEAEEAGLKARIASVPLFQVMNAVCVESVFSAKMARAVNDSNAITLGAMIVAPWMAKAMVDTWLETKHTEGLESFAGFLKDACMDRLSDGRDQRGLAGLPGSVEQHNWGVGWRIRLFPVL